MSKIHEIIKSGIAPGFPQKDRMNPNGAQVKALKGLAAVENEPLYKHGPVRGASRIAKYFGFSTSEINKAWRRPFKRRIRSQDALTIVSGLLIGVFCLMGSVRTAEAGSLSVSRPFEPTAVLQVGSGQYLIHGPTESPATPEQSRLDAKLPRPLDNCQPLATVFPPHIGALIVALGDIAGPSTVLLGIAFVIVYAVKRHAGGAFTHVHKEILERMKPAFANCNSSLKIILSFIERFWTASLLHVHPRLILTAQASRFFSVAMRGKRFCSIFFDEAAARFGIAFGKSPFAYLCQITAIAFAVPYRVAPFINMRKRQDGKTVKLLPGYVCSIHILILIVLMTGICQQRCFGASYTQTGYEFIDGSLVYAAQLNQAVANLTIGPGFITSQPINPNPLASDLLLDERGNELYQITLESILTNSAPYTIAPPGQPNVFTNDTFLFYSAADSQIQSVIYSNLLSDMASNLPVQNLDFAPTNNPGATNIFALPDWFTPVPYQTNNQPWFLVWGTNGVPYQIPYSNLVNNAQTTVQSNSVGWMFAQEFTPWTIYGTNTVAPYTNLFGYTTNFPIVSLNRTNIAGTATNATLTDSDTIPVNAANQGPLGVASTNTSMSLLALYQYLTNKNALPPYTIARIQFSGVTATASITNMSAVNGIITNVAIAVNWSNATPVSFGGDALNGVTSPTLIQSNTVYWAQVTNNANLGFQIFTNLADAQARVSPLIGNGVNPTANGTLYYVTNYTAVNCVVIQEANAGSESIRTGFYDIFFTTPSATPLYYVSGIAQGANVSDPDPVLCLDYLYNPNTNSVSITTYEAGNSGFQFPLVHVLIQPE